MLKGIIYDMDGTLTLTNTLHALAFQKLFARYGVELSMVEYFDDYLGLGAREIIASKMKDSKISVEALMEERSPLFQAELEKAGEGLLIPGTVSFLQYCQSRGWKQVVASGAGATNIDMVLKKAGITDYFEKTFSGQDCAHSKPWPDVYLKALDFLDLSPDEVLVFEDSLPGVQSAVSAGLACVALKTTSPVAVLEEAGAVLLIDDYVEMLENLQINPQCLDNYLKKEKTHNQLEHA